MVDTVLSEIKTEKELEKQQITGREIVQGYLQVNKQNNFIITNLKNRILE